MTRTTKTTARRTGRTSQPATPPAGLSHAFKLIAMDGYTSIASRNEAARIYPIALRVIAALHGQHAGRYNDKAIETELLGAADAFYGTGASADASVTAEAGFRVGFAVCWLLMQSMTGGAR